MTERGTSVLQLFIPSSRSVQVVARLGRLPEAAAQSDDRTREDAFRRIGKMITGQILSPDRLLVLPNGLIRYYADAIDPDRCQLADTYEWCGVEYDARLEPFARRNRLWQAEDDVAVMPILLHQLAMPEHTA